MPCTGYGVRWAAKLPDWLLTRGMGAGILLLAPVVYFAKSKKKHGDGGTLAGPVVGVAAAAESELAESELAESELAGLGPTDVAGLVTGLLSINRRLARLESALGHGTQRGQQQAHQAEQQQTFRPGRPAAEAEGGGGSSGSEEVGGVERQAGEVLGLSSLRACEVAVAVENVRPPFRLARGPRFRFQGPFFCWRRPVLQSAVLTNCAGFAGAHVRSTRLPDWVHGRGVRHRW